MAGMPRPDYYKILQVDPLAEEEVVEAAYRRLARKYHPDVYAGPDASERMRELNLAYSVIGDAAQRLAYDNARQREAARAEAQAALTQQSSMARRTTTGRQRAVSAATISQYAAAPPNEGARLRSKEAALRRMQSKVPSVKVSTGDWPAITPTTGKLPVTPAFVYRRPLSMIVFEELRNLGQGILVIGLIGYPIAVALCWFPLQSVWAGLHISQHRALAFTLALLLLPMLALCWWFGRRIRRERL
ncbi:MAG TPA: J domain-containing protein [Ktedonobacterales bacterium]|nr:J domain-containing protein [Ktedonobacterales bacterium]